MVRIGKSPESQCVLNFHPWSYKPQYFRFWMFTLHHNFQVQWIQLHFCYTPCAYLHENTKHLLKAVFSPPIHPSTHTQKYTFTQIQTKTPHYVHQSQDSVIQYDDQYFTLLIITFTTPLLVNGKVTDLLVNCWLQELSRSSSSGFHSFYCTPNNLLLHTYSYYLAFSFK